jgi:hypothetical protein
MQVTLAPRLKPSPVAPDYDGLRMRSSPCCERDYTSTLAFCIRYSSHNTNVAARILSTAVRHSLCSPCPSSACQCKLEIGVHSPDLRPLLTRFGHPPSPIFRPSSLGCSPEPVDAFTLRPLDLGKQKSTLCESPEQNRQLALSASMVAGGWLRLWRASHMHRSCTWLQRNLFSYYDLPPAARFTNFFCC